jgi:hypothetical protein
MIELDMRVGLRTGELFGLHGDRVDWLRGRLTVVDVMTREDLREWPKPKRSHGVVPVPRRCTSSGWRNATVANEWRKAKARHP